MAAEAIVAAVRARGSDATDVRDAAHEACHALMWGVSKKWTRNNIHRKCPRRSADKVADEITARAVEMAVCGRFGVAYDLKHWAFVAWIEMLKNEKISLPTDGWLATAIRERLKSRRTQEMVDRVCALAREVRS